MWWGCLYVEDNSTTRVGLHTINFVSKDQLIVHFDLDLGLVR